MFGRKPPPGRTPTRIAGEVDPQALERARHAVEVKVAKTRIRSMARDDDGARKIADALRKLINESPNGEGPFPSRRRRPSLSGDG